MDLRVARVVKAEHIEEARKLLKLTLSLGGNETRTVFAGIKEAYVPESLVGRLVVVVANLAPRKMKFGTSEGMIVAAGPGQEGYFLAFTRRWRATWATCALRRARKPTAKTLTC